MGFKKIKKKDLEMSLNSAFIGSPIRSIEDKIDISEEFTDTERVSILDKATGIIIQNEENLIYVNYLIPV